ncbi:MAG: RNA polymerase sigma factor [Candidatus Orphnella occulta]|nr:RNA polymerase sigma factor [Candidatus Orphnella occulta]
MSYDQRERIFKVFYKRYFKKIRSRVMRLLNNERYAAEDIAQETFMRAYTNLEKIVNRTDFLKWTYTVSRNLSYNYTRSKQYSCKESLNRKIGSDQDNRELSDIIADTKTEAPDIVTQQKERMDMLLSAMDRLAYNYRSVLELCSIRGLSYNVAAVELNMSPNAVAHNLMRAKRKVMAMIEQ